MTTPPSPEATGAPTPDTLVNPDQRITNFEVPFMGQDAVDTFRQQQKGPVRQAGIDAVQALTPQEASERGDIVRDEARVQAVEESVADYVSTHVPQAWIDARPELRGRFSDILNRYSYHNMSEREWQRGLPAGVHGTDRNNQRPGRERLTEEVDALIAEYASSEPTPPNPLEGLPTPDELRDLSEAVVGARNRLAELSIARRQLIRKHGRKANRLAGEYEAAEAAHKAASRALLVARARYYRAGVNTDGTTYTPNDAATLANIDADYMNEHIAFSQAERHYLQTDDRLRARVARFLIDKHILSTGVSFALGFGSEYLVKGVAGAALAAGAPIALTGVAGLMSVKAAFAGTVGNVQAAHRQFDRRYTADHTTLGQALANERGTQLNGGEPANHESFIDRAHNVLLKVIGDRVESDRKSNRNRVIAETAIAGFFGLAGAGTETVLAHTGVLGSGHTPTHPSGTPATPSIHPPATPPSIHPPAPGNHNVVDGFHTNVHVGNGEGYEQALTDLANQKGIHLTGNQSAQLYSHLQHLKDTHQLHGDFFTNDPSYHMSPSMGEWGISHAGAAHWNPAVIHEVNNWLAQNNLHSAAGKAAKKAARAAVGRVVAV